MNNELPPEGWYVQYNPLDWYYELISFPRKEQAWDTLKMIDNCKAPEELIDEVEKDEEWQEKEDEEEDYEFFQEGDQEDQETL